MPVSPSLTRGFLLAAVWYYFKGIESCGFKAHGGEDAPYVYVDLEGKPSWDVFSEILEKAQVCTNRIFFCEGRGEGLVMRNRYCCF